MPCQTTNIDNRKTELKNERLHPNIHAHYVEKRKAKAIPNKLNIAEINTANVRKTYNRILDTYKKEIFSQI